MGRLLMISAPLAILAAYLVIYGWDTFEPKTIRNQRVLVTGASSGIGEQLAYQYAELGARLVITARRTDLLQKVSRNCEDLGAPDVHIVAADMASPDDRSTVIEHVRKYLGGLDHLVLNHAILTEGKWTGSAGNITHLEQVLNVNFVSYVDLTSKALPMLIASQGRIGIVSSTMGQTGSALATVYSSSKFALHGFFASLRQELLHGNSGVSVSVVLLGFVSTDAMMVLRDKELGHLPVEYMATPTATARAILESVALRRYKTYYDWKMNVCLNLHSVFPQFMEDLQGNTLLKNDSHWASRLMLFYWRTIF